MDKGMQDADLRALDAGDFAPAERPAHDHPLNLLAVVHRRLRGRYHWAALAAVILAVPGAILGYKAKNPQYTSTGIIQVAPTLPVTLYKIPENELPPMYDTLVEAQAKLVQSRNVFDKACENPKLRDVGWAASPLGVRDLKQAIRVRWDRGSQLIQVDAVHENAMMAQRAVNAVLDAYYLLYGEQTGVAAQQNQESLRQRERQLNGELDALRKQIASLSENYGPAGLRTLHQQKLDDLGTFEKQLSLLNDAIAHSESRDGGGGTGRIGAVEMLAQSDRQLAGLIDHQASIVAEIERLKAYYGPNHRTMMDLKNQLAAVQTQIDARMRELSDAGGSGATDARLMSSLAQASIPQMKELRDRLATRIDGLRDEAAKEQAKLLFIDSLTEQATEKKQLLTDTTRRLDEIGVELNNRATKRVDILQRGDLPVAPDDKRMVLAGAGAMFGGAMGVALVFFLSLFDRGYRYINDLETDTLSAPLLGTLPDLTERTPEHDEMAALSVHHLRNMLQMQVVEGAGGARVITITSASAGDGKTSLTLALGMSFAVSGQRTLLLDADLVGRGLTRELRLDRAPGLCQAIGAQRLNGEAQTSSVENLWTLPAGLPDVEAKHLSHAGMARILETLRKEYDIVLIDTGPILGSLEANLVAALSDGVVLAVSRGQSHKFVAACLDRLNRMGARVAGLVFNRAESRDFDRSVSAASVCSQSLRPGSPGAAGAPRAGEERRTSRAALVRAVIGAGGGEPGRPSSS